jgi:uncharacterized phosphosugar-binding protein
MQVAVADAALKEREAATANAELVVAQQAARQAALDAQEGAVAAAAQAAEAAAGDVARREAAVADLQAGLMEEMARLKEQVEAQQARQETAAADLQVSKCIVGQRRIRMVCCGGGRYSDTGQHIAGRAGGRISNCKHTANMQRV